MASISARTLASRSASLFGTSRRSARTLSSNWSALVAASSSSPDASRQSRPSGLVSGRGPGLAMAPTSDLRQCRAVDEPRVRALYRVVDELAVVALTLQGQGDAVLVARARLDEPEYALSVRQVVTGGDP